MRFATKDLLYLCCLWVVSPTAPSRVSAGDLWQKNQPIVRISKEVYQPMPRSDTALWCWTYYVGPSLERVEYFYEETGAMGDDVHFNARQWFSEDNGRTWGRFEALPHLFVHKAGAAIMPDRVPRVFYDSAAGVTLKISDCAILKDQRTWYHHANYALSFDHGRTYGTSKPIWYERGGVAYDPADPLNENFLNSNRAATGNNIVQLADGSVVHALQALVPHTSKKGRTKVRTNTIPMRGQWNPTTTDYDWRFGDVISVPANISSIGLVEPNLAVLNDGRVLIVWRMDNGFKFYSVSSDGAKTFSEPAQLKYDDGSSFYSPSSIAFMLRHSVTRKLYWIGNITSERPEGSLPRYPLVIAEVDEVIRALKKDSVTLIDTRQKGESEKIQFSNFSLLENRETHEIELFVSPLGFNPTSLYEAPVRRYRLKL